LRKSNRRQAFASHAAAIPQCGLAAFGRIAIEKSVLPFAADFRRLILAFHKFKSLAPFALKIHLTERQSLARKCLVSRRR
jgi:hypothetical protein